MTEPRRIHKHTYNQAFCIYALSSYYEASGDAEALELAKKLFTLIETTCMDEVGYLEAFTRDFKPESNEKLSGERCSGRQDHEYPASCF